MLARVPPTESPSLPILLRPGVDTPMKLCLEDVRRSPLKWPMAGVGYALCDTRYPMRKAY